MILVTQAKDAGLPVPVNLTRAFKFSPADRAYIKRNPYYVNKDTSCTFKQPHGCGDVTLSSQRQELHEHNTQTTGWQHHWLVNSRKQDYFSQLDHRWVRVEQVDGKHLFGLLIGYKSRVGCL
jgi:hypothetical protein